MPWPIGTNDNAVTFTDTGRSVYKWVSFKDVDGNNYPSGSYWEIGYQDGVGVLLSKEKKDSPRFFVETSGMGNPWQVSVKKYIWIFLALVILYFILKRK